VDTVTGAEEVRTGFQVISCAVCHDPHSADNPAQLRVYDTVTLPGDVEVTGVGASATCMSCHNGRRGPEQVKEEEPSWSHYSTAAEMVTGNGGYDYGVTLKNSAHIMMKVDCVKCHMAETPGWEDEEQTKPLPGHDEVGAHTFKVVNADGVENVGACTECHTDLTAFNVPAKADYDGDGDVEGVQDEVQGLLDLVLAKIQESGVKALESHPYWEEVTTESQKAAVYNYTFVKNDQSLGIHNTMRAVQLLQLSYKDLAGADVPGATLVK